MNRRRGLGLAIVMALALAAFPAAASAAGGFVATTYPASLFSQSSTNAEMAFGTQETVVCPSAEISGSLTAPSKAINASLTLGGCKDSTSVDMNGCKLEFHPASGSTDIGPPGCGPIKVTGYWCDRTIGSQTGLATSYANVAEGKSSVQATVQGNFKYTTLPNEGGPFCPKESTQTNGQFRSSWLIRANGGAAGLQVTGPGFFLAGKGSEVEAEQPRFEAEEFLVAGGSAVPLTGSQDPKSGFTISIPGAGSIVCGSGQFNAEATSPSAQLTVGASYGECEAFGTPGTVDMNGCNYAFTVANSGPPYSGSFGLNCAAGDAIEVDFALIGNSCTLKIGTQTPSSTVAYNNQGVGLNRAVHASASGSAISYTREGSGFCALVPKSGKNGTMSGGFTMKAM